MCTERPGLYAIYCLRNGWAYYSSASNISKRWYAHRKMLSIGKHYNRRLQKDWVAYGSDAFSFSLLVQCGVAAARVQETDLISTHSGKVYNECPDGRPSKGRKASADERKVRSTKPMPWLHTKACLSKMVATAHSRGSYQTKLTADDVRDIRSIWASTPHRLPGKRIRADDGCVSMQQLADKYKIRVMAIHSVVRRRTWKHI